MTRLAEPVPAAAAATPQPDLAAIKQRQRATWASGDFAVIGTTLQIVGEQLAEAADIRAGEKVLDVAAGNGNATLAAARRFARVTSTDYVPQLLEKGAERAIAEGLDVEFQTADAEALPFADGTFDVALSTFGVMFAPDQPRAAAEMARVVKHGGRVGLANWTRAGFLGELFQVIAKYAPPPPGVPSPMQWGDEEQLRHLFKHAKVHAAKRNFMFRYQSPQHWIDIFRKFYGPIHKAYASIDASGQQHLYDDLEAMLKRRNTAGANSLVVPGEYLEAVITLR